MVIVRGSSLTRAKLRVRSGQSHDPPRQTCLLALASGSFVALPCARVMYSRSRPGGESGPIPAQKTSNARSGPGPSGSIFTVPSELVPAARASAQDLGTAPRAAELRDACAVGGGATGGYGSSVTDSGTGGAGGPCAPRGEVGRGGRGSA